MATEGASPNPREVREACARWAGRAKAPASEAAVRAAIRALYEASGAPPPRSIEITRSPRELAAVSCFRLDRSDPEGVDALDLASHLWTRPLMRCDNELVTTIDRTLRVVSYPRSVNRLVECPERRVARAYVSDASQFVCAPAPPSVEFVSARSSLGELVARELRGGELRPFVDVLDTCEWLCLGARRAVVSLHPEVQQVDDWGGYHRVDGPAVRWLDGTQLWCWHGWEVDRRAMEAPETLPLDSVLQESRPGLRHWLIERIGLGRFLLAAGAESIARDETGELYRLAQPRFEPIVAIRVEDRVLDERGVPKEHWIQVPPEMRTPRAAVAWTFGLAPRRYRPEVET